MQQHTFPSAASSAADKPLPASAVSERPQPSTRVQAKLGTEERYSTTSCVADRAGGQGGLGDRKRKKAAAGQSSSKSYSVINLGVIAVLEQGDLKANAMRLKRSLKQELEACEKLCRPEGVCQQESSKAVDLAIQVPNGIPLKAYVTQVPWVSQNALQGHRAHRKLA